MSAASEVIDECLSPRQLWFALKLLGAERAAVEHELQHDCHSTGEREAHLAVSYRLRHLENMLMSRYSEIVDAGRFHADD